MATDGNFRKFVDENVPERVKTEMLDQSAIK